MKIEFPFSFSLEWPNWSEGKKKTVELPSTTSFLSVNSSLDRAKGLQCPNFSMWGLSLLSVIPWAINANESSRFSTTSDKLRLPNQEQPGFKVEGTWSNRVRFRPYVSKVPWHTGPRAFLSTLFPRYGHYCGPNWSSGKDGGNLLWDRRPIDWLDYCCYCHDMGYDTHDQAKLLEADLAFLECLEKPLVGVKGDAHVASLYKTMCTTGLKNILIPYRMQLVNLQSGQEIVNFGWLTNMKWISSDLLKRLNDLKLAK